MRCPKSQALVPWVSCFLIDPLHMFKSHNFNTIHTFLCSLWNKNFTELMFWQELLFKSLVVLFHSAHVDIHNATREALLRIKVFFFLCFGLVCSLIAFILLDLSASMCRVVKLDNSRNGCRLWVHSTLHIRLP